MMPFRGFMVSHRNGDATPHLTRKDSGSTLFDLAAYDRNMGTAEPDTARPETPSARLAWLDLEEALSTVAEDNLRVCLLRIADLLNR